MQPGADREPRYRTLNRKWWRSMPIGESLEDQRTTISVLYWGREGSGKTTHAFRMMNLAPKGKIVVINAEAGAKRVALVQHGIDPKRAELWPTDAQGGPKYITYERIIDEVVEPMRAALAKDPAAYIGVVIDSGTEVARRLLEDVRSEQYDKAQRLGKNRGRWDIDLKDHGISASMMRALLREFRDLGVNVAITALERRDVDQDTSAVMYGPAFGPAVASDTAGLVDVVAFCQVEDIAGEQFRTATFTPTINRRAKDRFGMLPVSMVDPQFDRIHDYIEGTLTRDNDPGRARLIAAISSEKPPETTAPAAPAVDESKTEDAPASAENESAVAAEEAKVA